jgi:hypothetical protein
MFDPKSRYRNLPTAEIVRVDADGTATTIRYVRRRFVPRPEPQLAISEHRVLQGDRLDRIANRYLTDPDQYWRICDANLVFSPGELTDELGRVIDIALPTR